MKVFVPMSDELLDRQDDVAGRIVPFDPEFLESRATKGRKPANWISDSDFQTACRRLRDSQREAELSPA